MANNSGQSQVFLKKRAREKNQTCSRKFNLISFYVRPFLRYYFYSSQCFFLLVLIQLYVRLYLSVVKILLLDDANLSNIFSLFLTIKYIAEYVKTKNVWTFFSVRWVCCGIYCKILYLLREKIFQIIYEINFDDNELLFYQINCLWCPFAQYKRKILWRKRYILCYGTDKIIFALQRAR